ncbi:MAG: NAD(P)-dependent dehydrogenase (short-subunit alcohol dehydrogenase family) [Gammaproteobacteria bacterium]|jgi:NAD(P)-dependent dehydrogenase (short-subunit alcohol dehydrogenase family)
MKRSSNKPSVAIIGASRGIGLELTRQYAQAGWQVHATTRTPRSPGELGQVAADVTVHCADMRAPDPVRALADALANRSIDVLIHNAGIKDSGYSREEVMHVNAAAPIVVVETLLDVLGASANGRIVLMGSQMGARRGLRGNLGTYGDSKAALNDAFRERSLAWKTRNITAIVMHPGWVRTDMGGAGAPVSVKNSATGIRKVIDRLSADDHGKFFTWRGEQHPW